jgi:NAD(P)-dependent dehydrogenase (short-subunit alcohol dehydrogenase family)
MTGGTSGIGLAALKRLQRNSGVQILIGARGKGAGVGKALPLDLERLTSVRRFAAAVEESLGAATIDCLVLNAGMQVGDTSHRTEDGFETTFAVNHLAHYLLLRLLQPSLSVGAIVVITTSNLHDPKTNPIAAPEHVDARKLARGEVELVSPPGPRSGIRAYAASKLCNLLTAQALMTSAFAKEKGVRVIAFNPGFIAGTRLTRHQPLTFKLPYTLIVPVLSVFQRMNTLEGAGKILADLALGEIAPPPGRFYASQVERELTWPDPSDVANDAAAVTKLWRDSAALVGLPVDAEHTLYPA